MGFTNTWGERMEQDEFQKPNEIFNDHRTSTHRTKLKNHKCTTKKLNKLQHTNFTEIRSSLISHRKPHNIQIRTMIASFNRAILTWQNEFN